MTRFTHNAYILAELAGCAAPDFDSDGATFLVGIMHAVEDAIDNDETDEEALDQIANDAPDGAIVRRWQEFVDLKGWQIDTTDLTGDRISARALSEHAHSVLFLIAENLVKALIAEHNAKNTDGE